MVHKRQEKQDEQFDAMIQQRVQTSFLADINKLGIEPSDDFAHKVMRDCINCERDRSKNNAIMLSGFAILPFLARELWMFIRGDYVSVHSLPFDNIIYEMYMIVLSPITSYILGFLGLGFIAYIYIKKWRPLRRERNA